MIQDLIDKTPDNSTLVIPPGLYVQEPTIRIIGRQNLRIVADGVVMARLTSQESKAWGHDDRQILAMNCTGLSIHGWMVAGPKPDTVGYQVAYESQHALAIVSCTDVIVDGMFGYHNWGDHFYLTGTNHNITIIRCRGLQCGRHGVSVNSVDGLVHALNVYQNSHRWCFSMERNVPSDSITNVFNAFNGFYGPTIGFVSGGVNGGSYVGAPNTCTWAAAPAGTFG